MLSGLHLVDVFDGRLPRIRPNADVTAEWVL
jgi:hypothetical protein